MNGSAQYEILQRIAGIKIVVFRGKDASGRPALLHQLTDANDHTEVLTRAVRYLLRNPSTAGGRILDLTEIDGAQYLVTLDEPECLALREWLDWELERPAPSVSSAPSAAAPAAHTPGEFTRMFQAPAAPNPSAQQNASPQSGSQQSGSQPGEFTKMFERAGLDISSGRVREASPPPVPPAPLAEQKQPGEFTRLFRSPLAAPSSVGVPNLPASPPPQHTPGQFTQMFGVGALGGSRAPANTTEPAPPTLTESVEPGERPPLSPMTAAPAASGPGEFTRMMNRPATARNPAMPPAPAPSMPSSTGAAPMPAAFTIPAAPLPTIPAAPSVPQAPAAPAPAIPAPQPLQMPMSSPGEQRSPGGGPSTKAIIILFGVLLLVALALVILVVLRR